MGNGRTVLSPVQADGVWRVQITCPTAASNLVCPKLPHQRANTLLVNNALAEAVFKINVGKLLPVLAAHDKAGVAAAFMAATTDA
jgi:hypothetical protein